MGKKRILEVSVNLNKKVNDIINLANRIDINVKNAMSSISEEEEKKIKDNLFLLDELEKSLEKSKNVEKNNTNIVVDNIKTDTYKKENLKEKTNTLNTMEDKKTHSKDTNKKITKSFTSKKKLKEQKLMEEKFQTTIKEKEKKSVSIDKNINKTIKIKKTISLGELSQQMGVPVSDIIKYLFSLGVMSNINTILDMDTIEIIADEYNCTIIQEKIIDSSDLSNFIKEDEINENNLVSRPPIVTIMGHVDHGKTTLLDTIRKSNIAGEEHGGITQHIGAYQIIYNNEKITFLDTPGHEAFTSMRARGAKVTDIVLILVAADDGVKPQTKEAIDHAKSADVEIIVVINKIDTKNANVNSVMQELTELGLQPESWGGNTVTIEVSAKNGKNIDELLDMILLIAEMKELKANDNSLAYGTVIEARLDKGRGPIATLLVQGGKLKKGEPIVVGNTFGKVRTMSDDLGILIKEATISQPVEITGLLDVPSAGDKFIVFSSEKEARKIGEERSIKAESENRSKNSIMSLDDLNKKAKEGEINSINIIIKADVKGSTEALSQSLMKIDINDIKIKIIREAVGPITESDVMLASATNSLIYGFNIRVNSSIKQLAENENVDIRLHTVIYDVLEEFEKAVKGMLAPKYEEKIIGHAEVRQLFKMSKIGTIAGCKVLDGEIKRDGCIRLLRDSVIVYTGKIASLKREKNDIKKVQEGYECGITIENYNDIKVNDIIEMFEDQKIESE